MLDDRDPRTGDDHRHRLGRAFGRRHQRAARRGLELLHDRMRQDALAPVFSTMYPSAVSWAGSGDPTSASKRISRAPGTDVAQPPCSLM